VTRIITFPDSLNRETGLICSYLGGEKDVEKMEAYKIFWQMDATRFLYYLTLIRVSDLHPHLEPRMPEAGRVRKPV